MAERLSIGQFAKLTHLSVKTLRHYHDALDLSPADVDPTTGYRYYEYSQDHRAHLVRQLRLADMPLSEIAALLAESPADRRALIADHADRVTRRALAMGDAADALRTALDGPVIDVDIRRVYLAPRTGLISAGVGDLDTIQSWCEHAFVELDEAFDRVLPATARADTAPYGWFSSAFFEGAGPVGVGVALSDDAVVNGAAEIGAGGIRIGPIPGGTYLVATHVGDRADIGRAYTALGSYVGHLGIGDSDRAVVERYEVSAGDVHTHRTDVCWPIEE